MLQKLISGSVEMEDFGALMARHIPAGAVVFLRGNLGAGKTTLVRGFLHELGYRNVIKSPTFTLVEPYYLSDITVFHFDFYRISDPEELEAMGYRDYLESTAICMIEWPEKAGHILGDPDILVIIDHQPNSRQLTISAHSPAGESALHKLA